MSFRSGFVGVVGRPNVGKSTLVNYYVGQKVAIATPMPQTTRHKILGILTRPEAQIIFVDTPGFHDPQHTLGQYMVKTALGTLDAVDLLLVLIDARRGYLSDDHRLIQAVARAKRPAFLVLNKVDLVRPKQRLLPLIEAARQFGCFRDFFPVSSLKGDQMDVLLQHIIPSLPEGPLWFTAPQVTDRSRLFQMAELIREQVIRHTFEEVPHAVAVSIEHLEEQPDPQPLVIHATIVVERETQKGILIGKGGQKLKAIGAQARLGIEQLVHRHVFLQLWVKVTEDWRRDPHQLRALGYGE